jgi:hypothetical protein
MGKQIALFQSLEDELNLVQWWHDNFEEICAVPSTYTLEDGVRKIGEIRDFLSTPDPERIYLFFAESWSVLSVGNVPARNGGWIVPSGTGLCVEWTRSSEYQSRSIAGRLYIPTTNCTFHQGVLALYNSTTRHIQSSYRKVAYDKGVAYIGPKFVGVVN